MSYEVHSAALGPHHVARDVDLTALERTHHVFAVLDEARVAQKQPARYALATVWSPERDAPARIVACQPVEVRPLQRIWLVLAADDDVATGRLRRRFLFDPIAGALDERAPHLDFRLLLPAFFFFVSATFFLCSSFLMSFFVRATMPSYDFKRRRTALNGRCRR